MEEASNNKLCDIKKDEKSSCNGVINVDHENEKDSLQTNNSKAQIPFKMPQLIISSQRGKNVKRKNVHSSIGLLKEIESETQHKEINKECLPSDCEKGNISEGVEKHFSKVTPSLPYEEPEWSGLPLDEYRLEELKSGTILKTIDLTKRSFSVFGRLEHCDIPMLHPTVSRYHAVLQYRSTGDEQNDPGFYIYDLGSSLGTFLNKQKLKPKTFVRVKVGYVLKIGCSTRMFILQGPAEDEEPESELSVTQLKEQYQQKLAAMEAENARLVEEEKERAKKEEERGIDWGMGEDADEETDLTENPYASTQNEDLYLDDPKKTLRGWFEREGEELEYDVEEKGFGHFVCRIELPVDNGGGGNLVAEASVKGKKKEAVVQAALEACRLLDRQGLLRQSNHESKKRAAKDWEAVDFYDSDEDNFLDRTGHVEKKRQQRMAQSGKLEKPVETYETLVKKYTKIADELEDAEKKLKAMLDVATHSRRHQSGEGEENEDDLDSYMNTLHEVSADKIEIKKMKVHVVKLRTEEERVKRLVNLVRPTEMPKFELAVKSDKEKKMIPVMIGKIATKKKTKPDKLLPRETTKQQLSPDTGEEFDEEDEPSKSQEDKNEPVVEVVEKKKRNRVDTRNRTSKRQFIKMQVDDEDFSNCTWTPPEGQTGDGRTSLNDKLGY